MANTYTQIHIQFVFAVKYRAALIGNEWKERLHQYTTGIFRRNNHKMLQINSMPDHIHIFIGMRPHQSISSLMQLVKTETSLWIKEQNLCPSPFAWQEARLTGRAGVRCFFLCKKPGSRCSKVYSKSGNTSPKRNIFR
jgi:putative transposase